jgi:hypothetical protein
MDRAEETIARAEQHRREMAEMDATYAAMEEAEYAESMAELDARDARDAERRREIELYRQT